MKQLFVFISLLLGASVAYGQHWTHLIDTVAERRLVPYFINPDYGFTFDFDGSKGVFRTRDGGVSWTPITFFDSIDCTPIQMCFVSPSHGFAAAFHRQTYSGIDAGIFETYDSGTYWARISPPGFVFSSVYVAGNTVFGLNLFTGNILYTRNEGASWDSITIVNGISLTSYPEFRGIYGNLDSLVATIYYQGDAYYNGYQEFKGKTILVYSTDQGHDWESEPIPNGVAGFGIQMSGISIHVLPHTCRIIRQYCDSIDFQFDKYQLYFGELPYRNWQFGLRREMGAFVAGNSCAMYALECGQDGLPEDDTLLYRSMNGGISWQGIPRNPIVNSDPDFAEIDDYDWPNLSVVGHGAVVYSGDGAGGLWKTTDGWDGTLNVSALASHFALSHSTFAGETDTLTWGSCNPTPFQVYNQNVGCSYAKFDSISIVGLDPSEYSIISTHHCTCEPMPDTSFITLQPKDTGTQNLTIHYHFTDDEYNQTDTSIQVMLAVKPGGTSVTLSMYLKQNSISLHAGDTINIPIYLSGSAALSGSTSLLLPFALDTNMLRVLGFHPTISGITVGALSYSGSTGTVPLQASGLTINGETLLGTLRCIVYLSDSLSTSVSLLGASISSDDPRCLALSTTSDAVTIMLTGCGDSIILAAMVHAPPYSIESVVPNPAQGEITVTVAAEDAGAITCELYDALGNLVLQQPLDHPASSAVLTPSYSAGLHRRGSIEVSFLPSGTYFLRLSQNGYVQSRPVSIAR